MKNLLIVSLVILTLIACDKDKEALDTPQAGDMAGMEMGGSDVEGGSTEAGMEMDATVEGGSEMNDMGMGGMVMDAGSEGGVEGGSEGGSEGGVEGGVEG